MVYISQFDACLPSNNALHYTLQIFIHLPACTNSLVTISFQGITTNMSSVRTLNWFESEFDNTTIANNNWNFQLATTVASGSAAPTCNVVWQSRALAPGVSVSWKVEYALGWMATVPDQGVRVRIVGQWQPCNKGESYDVNEAGYWVKSATPGDPGWLNVGNIKYSYPGVLGIHVVVGMRNAQTNLFDPIFVDKAILGPGSSARYQPQEMVSWWLEGQDLTGQVFTRTKSNSAHQDFSNPSDPVTNTFEWSTTFLTIPSRWTISAGPPPALQITPPPSVFLAALSLGGTPPLRLQLDYANWLVTFAMPLASAALAAAATALYGQLKDKFKSLKVTVDGKDGSKLSVQYEFGNGAAPGTPEYWGIPAGSAGGPALTIDDGLRAVQKKGDIPVSERWTITAAKTPTNHSDNKATGPTKTGPIVAQHPESNGANQQYNLANPKNGLAAQAPYYTNGHIHA